MEKNAVLAILAVVGVLGVICVVLSAVLLCGYISRNSGVTAPTAVPEPTEVPGVPTPSEPPVQPTQNDQGGSPVVSTVITTPVQTSTPTPTPTPVTGNVSAELTGYGTDKDTYSRGDTATCYVNVKNTGDVTIDQVDFRVDVYRSAFGMMIHAINNQTYTVDQQGIQPGTTKRVEISVLIPSEYKGVSTAGSYRFDIVVFAGGKEIGKFSENVAVV